MKLAVLSESPADDAALRILVEALLGAPTEVMQLKSIRRRSGVSSIPLILPVVVRELHFNSDADGLVFTVDSNGTPMHTSAHVEHAQPNCRLCALRTLLEGELSALSPQQGWPPLKTGVGVACPSIEAWYLSGQDPSATEAAWSREANQKAAAPERIRELKSRVYGMDKPNLALETERAVAAAHRLAADLSILEQRFPAGFGALARDVRKWRDTP